ncbi:MAG: hypothetical protein IPM76_22280 [Chloroflexi bacterium]|nr:hypothetical protein [Chloroflexota bacterium]
MMKFFFYLVVILVLAGCGSSVNGRCPPTTWLNLMNCGRNGRFHPTLWLNL